MCRSVGSGFYKVTILDSELFDEPEVGVPTRIAEFCRIVFKFFALWLIYGATGASDGDGALVTPGVRLIPRPDSGCRHIRYYCTPFGHHHHRNYRAGTDRSCLEKPLMQRCYQAKQTNKAPTIYISISYGVPRRVSAPYSIVSTRVF